jgi:voltage-gated potassium channel
MDFKIDTHCISRHSRWRIAGFLGAFFALTAIFFVVPAFEKNFYTHLLLQSSFALLVLSTLYTLERQRTILLLGTGFLIPFIYFDSLSFQQHSLLYTLVAYGFSLGFILLAIVVLMRKILYAARVNVDLIFAALMVYLLSGILWADLYFIQNALSPGSFQGAGTLNFDSTIFSYEQQFNFLYYSFATLATLGMGDITPLNHLAKSLTAMEAMFGQLFVAVIIAKLVSAWWSVSEAK